MIGLEMLTLCAPQVAPETIQHVIRVESSGNPLALNINGAKLPRKPTDAADAAKIAREFMAAGYSVDLGLMQVNSKNLAKLGYSVEDMFEPCKNIAAGAKVLTNFYAGAKELHGEGQTALQAALSAYNTGSFTAGFSNGYVARYFDGQPVSAAVSLPATATVLNPYTATTVVFIRNQESTQMSSNSKPSEARIAPVLSGNIEDAGQAGVQVQVDAAEAERLGAHQETAIGEADAWAANGDLAPDPQGTAIVIGGKPVSALRPAVVAPVSPAAVNGKDGGHGE